MPVNPCKTKFADAVADCRHSDWSDDYLLKWLIGKFQIGALLPIFGVLPLFSLGKIEKKPTSHGFLTHVYLFTLSFYPNSY